MAKCAKGIQNARFYKGQKLTHSPAHEEKHRGQTLMPAPAFERRVSTTALSAY